MPTRNWFQVMVHSPTGWVIGPAVAYGIVAVFGMVYVLRRLYRGDQVSPGEMLWLILGVHQAVFWPAFWAIYKQELFPLAHPPKHLFAFWFCPRLAACMAILFARSKFPCTDWNYYFIALFIAFLGSTFDSMIPISVLPTEESLVTSIPPFITGVAAALGALLTFVAREPTATVRWRYHWSGLALAFLPLLWFAFWWSHGMLPYRPWFSQVVDG